MYRISNRPGVEEPHETPPAASRVARSRPEYEPLRPSAFAKFFGTLVLGYGLLLVGATSLQWGALQPPGSTVGPPSLIQAFVLRITEGIYLAVFGVVLAAGGFVLSHMDRRAKSESRSQPERRWRTLFPYAAVVLIVLGAVISLAPSPQRTLGFAASDFTLRCVPGRGPYENYLVSQPFSAFEGEAFFPWISIAWTDNRTGTEVERQNGETTWVIATSAFPSYVGFSFATGNIAPADGPYVLWVRYDLCETPATPPCSNYTASASGSLAIATQKAYVPAQLVLGAAGSALMVVALGQSWIGSRRATSR